MCNVSCVHINAFKTRDVMRSYEILHAYYVSCIAIDSFKRKARDCLCMKESCKVKYQRVHACLCCIYFGCFNNRHIHEHAFGNNHLLAMDTNYGYVYCFICGDYQYDAQFEMISQRLRSLSAGQRGPDENPASLELNLDDIDFLSRHQVVDSSVPGLRGVVNLRNTCYLSVIIQSLVHAPVFRDYLLSFQHNCDLVNAKDPSCFVCEMVDIVREFFSSKQDAYAPARLLYLLWIHDRELKGDMQQDAHHCYLALLNNLHLNCLGTRDNSLLSDHHCQCVVDSIFTGLLQYEYTCTRCKNVSVQSASFKDISLDLELHSHPTTENHCTANISSLDDCLRSAMKGYIQCYSCSKCMKQVDCSMQMNLKKLPLIISFHLKQSCNSKEQKIFINFPEFLDMSAYMPPSPVFPSNDQAQAVCGGESENQNSYKFYLFAVVEFEGTRNGGHYKCYVRRHRQDWFLCNDEDVYPVNIENVLKVKAYLLFYHRRYLEPEAPITERRERVS